jgi:hypothetical protein
MYPHLSSDKIYRQGGWGDIFGKSFEATLLPPLINPHPQLLAFGVVPLFADVAAPFPQALLE